MDLTDRDQPETPEPELNVLDLPLHAQAALLRSGQLSSVALTRASLERIRLLSGLNAFISVCESEALEQAEQADTLLRRGDGQALTGTLIALKDNLSWQGVPLSCGSRILEGYVAPYDATVVSRLKAAGCVLIGKTNMDEFAMGSSTEHSAFGACLNPWDPSRIPGGSSGGSAVATISGMASAALGSDTGGSIRQPAAMCGLVGLKPSWGRVSRYGLVAYGSSLDQIGPFGRTVRDVALLLEVLAGVDARDATSSCHPVEAYASLLEGPIDGLRIGLPRGFDDSGLQPAVRAAVERAIETFERLGARVQEVSLPHAAHGISVYYLIATAEASSNLARFDGVRFGLRAPARDLETLYVRSRSQGFGDEVKRRIMLGTYALSAGYYDAYYGKAQQVRELTCGDYAHAFEQVDLLLTPTTPTPAFALGEKEDPLSMYLADIYTVGANLAGLPAISLPCGRDAGGLPIGMQLLAPAFEESRLLRAAARFEGATRWHRQRPALDALEPARSASAPSAHGSAS